MKTITKEQTVNFLSRFSLYSVLMGILTGSNPLFAQQGQQGTTTTDNPFDLSKLAPAISKQTAFAKPVVIAIGVFILIGGVIHVIIAFVNQSPHLKTIVVSYLGAIIVLSIFSALV